MTLGVLSLVIFEELYVPVSQRRCIETQQFFDSVNSFMVIERSKLQIGIVIRTSFLFLAAFMQINISQ